MEFTLLPSGKETVVKTSAREIADLWVDYNNDPLKRKIGSQYHVFEESSFNGSIHETRDTLLNNKFVLEDFFNTKWYGKLRSDLAFLNLKSKKRKRSLSEHDGDFDIDRQYDIKLFNNSKTEPFDNRVIVDISFDISCSFSTKDIREYGKLCYHVINFIEEHGYVCDVNITQELTYLYSIKNDWSTKNTAIINIKRSDEYQDNITTCKYFTDWFYRRLMFNLYYHVGTQNKFGVSSSLGQCKQNLRTIGSPGYIYITPMLQNQIEGKMDFSLITKALQNALGGDKV